MARVEIPYTVEKEVSGNFQPAGSASVQVNVRGGGAALVYAAETGGSPIANPLTTDPHGEIAAWAEEGSYDLVVSGAGIVTRSVPIELTRGDATAVIATAKLGDAAVTTPKLADGAVTSAKLGDGQVTAAKLAAGVSPFAGELRLYAGTTAPAGWLLCDGSTVLVSSQPGLFAVIGYIYGGSGASFALPDFRGRGPVGPGPNADVVNVGLHDAVAPASRTPRHTHGIALDGSHNHGVNAHSHYMQPHFHTLVDAWIQGQTYARGNDNFATYIAHRGGIAEGTYLYTANNAGNYTDDTATVTDIAASHNHNGTTLNGVVPYLVVNFLIKT